MTDINEEIPQVVDATEQPKPVPEITKPVDTGIDEDELMEDDFIEVPTADLLEEAIIEELTDVKHTDNIFDEFKQFLEQNDKDLDEYIISGIHTLLPQKLTKSTLAVAHKYGINLGDRKQKLSKDLAELRERLLANLSLLDSNYSSDLDLREDSEWRQGVMPLDESGKIRRPAKTPTHRIPDPMLRAATNAGLNISMWWPLPHTGIWIEINTATNTQLLDLERRLTIDKDKFGRQTNGIAFSAVETYSNDTLLDFALSCIERTNGPDSSVEFLRANISPFDLKILLLAAGHGLYPQGYPYVRLCVSGEVINEESGEICSATEEGWINLSRMLWIDNAHLTDKQRLQMADRTKKVTLEQIKDYKEQFNERKIKRSMPYRVSPGGDIVGYINFAAPSLAEMISAGHRWISELNDSTNKAFGLDIQGRERENYIHYRAAIESVRQYAPWVKSITSVTSDGESEEVDEDYINNEKFLARLSSNPELRNNFFEAITDFIRDSTIALIGTVNVPCKVCGKESEEFNEHKRLIPIDVHQLFFTMATRTVEKQLVGQL